MVSMDSSLSPVNGNHGMQDSTLSQVNGDHGMWESTLSPVNDVHGMWDSILSPVNGVYYIPDANSTLSPYNIYPWNSGLNFVSSAWNCKTILWTQN